MRSLVEKKTYSCDTKRSLANPDIVGKLDWLVQRPSLHGIEVPQLLLHPSPKDRKTVINERKKH
jgi:hypothetical protein